MIRLVDMRTEALTRIANSRGADVLLATPYALSLPFQAEARRLYSGALRRREIVAASHCERCSKRSQTCGHHRDYREPFAVEWVCHSCHGWRHAELESVRIHQIIGAREILADRAARRAAGETVEEPVVVHRPQCCGLCGKPGHNVRKCPRAHSAASEAAA